MTTKETMIREHRSEFIIKIICSAIQIFVYRYVIYR